MKIGFILIYLFGFYISTIVILLSSISMHLAKKFIEKDNNKSAFQFFVNYNYTWFIICFISVFCLGRISQSDVFLQEIIVLLLVHFFI